MGLNLGSTSITTTGSAGSATGTGTVACQPGWLETVELDYHASAPATTDVTLTQTASPTALLTVTNNATDALIAPRLACVNTANSAITNSYTKIWVHGPVAVSVAQSDALTGAVVVYITTSEGGR